MSANERLQPFGPRLWIADGPTVSFYGFPYPTRMAVASLEGGLWIWSPIEPDDALVEEVRALGEVRWIVEPNKLHHLFLPAWLERFEGARAYAPPGLAKKKPEVSFAAELGDAPEPEWKDEIDQVLLGNKAFTEVIFLHRASSTALVCDLAQRMDPDSFHGWKRVAMKAEGLVGEHGSTPRELRALFVSRGPERAALERVLAWKPERLVIAHGACAGENGAAVLEDGLAWVTRPWPV